jgi:hypothetical protein
VNFNIPKYIGETCECFVCFNLNLDFYGLHVCFLNLHVSICMTLLVLMVLGIDLVAHDNLNFI